MHTFLFVALLVMMAITVVGTVTGAVLFLRIPEVESL